MRFKPVFEQPWTPVLMGLVSLAIATGCSSAPMTSVSEQEMASEEVQSAVGAPAPAADVADSVDSSVLLSSPQLPQLVKQASLWIELTDIDAAIQAVSSVMAQYQGELLQLSDQAVPADEPRQVNLQLRVPQTSLDTVLAELRSLGTVESQSITADDVSTQLVDLQARVRNLRKSEESLLEIMERSGAIAEVLEVSRELSTVREAIERHAAQLENLQNRVAYATITVTLVSPEASLTKPSPIGQTLAQTWQTAGRSFRLVSVSLLQLLLWLLVFSPYVGIVLLCLWGIQRSRRSAQAPSANHQNG